MLKVENVSKIYDGKRILNNLSFNVPEGEIYTLVGAIGEGKTTLLNMIAGFERIDEGNIYVKGTDCQLSSDKARKLFGFVPDVFPSYPTMTVKEYMRFFGRMMDSSDDEKVRHLTVNLLNFVGLKKVMDKRIGRLNRGQKQKLSIARALLHNPKLIILDEPFLGLDVESVHDIKEILDFLHGQGRTIFMTSDNLQLSASLSTSVGIIENGTMLYGDKTKEAYDNMRTHSVQLQHTGYIDQEEISRQLHEGGYMAEEEISRQLHEHGYMVEEEISRQLHNTGYIDQEEIDRQLHNTAYIDQQEISRQLHLEEDKKDDDDDESLNSLSDLGLDIDDFTPDFKELEYTSSITEDMYHDEMVYADIHNAVTKMPYSQVEAIENTRKGEDISKRLYEDKGHKSSRGIVEKRGVGGSRVVTDKNRNKSK